MIIANEIPSWVIDWVNKSFTFLNEIDYIVTLTVDWVEYTSFSTSWAIVTLTDAPVYSIYADYYAKNSVIPVTTDVTFWDIKSKVWNLLGQKPTSINFSSEIVGDEINAVSLDVWRGRVINLLNPQQIIRAWKLWFQDWKFWTRINAGWICTEKVEIWDTEIKTETANLKGAWYVLIWSDIINYTAKSSDQIEWVTGITTEHLVSDKITQLYEVPTDFETMEWIDAVITWSNTVVYKEIPLNSGNVSYKILRLWDKVLLQINWLSNEQEIRVRYAKKYNDLTLDDEITPFPDKYGINVIAYLVAGGLAYDKWLPTAERLLNRAYSNLRAMYQYFTNETKVTKQRLEPKHYSFTNR